MEKIATGWEAIDLAKKDNSIQLNKHTDPIDNFMENISIDFAEDVAREDHGLIFATKKGEEINW
ncbi:hypothetical protein LCGC14_2472130 [marine sediment metagenome]|uniref:Uncharacterized protein n=1 Tax=marine sediment metagenome TaxID=412755 RepID=A0A0F9BAU6_9ZZZZ